MKKIMICIIIVALLFLSGCKEGIFAPSGIKEEGGILDVELYDANGNLIGQSTIQQMAIVQDIPNVQFISVSSGMRNEGNVELDAKLFLYAPYVILEGITTNHPECRLSTRDNIICSKKLSIERGSLFVNSGKINVENIGYGTYKLMAQAIAVYVDADGQKQEISAEKTLILIIEKDPITAKISVDIGTSGITPPPPCIIECPIDTILEGDCCVPLKCLEEGIVCVQQCIEPRKICPIV